MSSTEIGQNVKELAIDFAKFFMKSVYIIEQLVPQKSNIG